VQAVNETAINTLFLKQIFIGMLIAEN